MMVPAPIMLIPKMAELVHKQPVQEKTQVAIWPLNTNIPKSTTAKVDVFNNHTGVPPAVNVYEIFIPDM